MVLIAVAGGTSPTLGRAITRAILEYNQEIEESTRNSVIILTRSRSPSDGPLEIYGAPVIPVDYANNEELVRVLKTGAGHNPAGVHTLICVTKIRDPQAMKEHQRQLVKAAKSAGSVRRFAPAEFSLTPEGHAGVDLLTNKEESWETCRSELQDTPSIEMARFVCGTWMNYFGYGSGNEAVQEGLDDKLWLPWFDGKNRKMAIPAGREDTVASACTIGDVGRFVARACTLPAGRWSELGGPDGVVGMVGENFTYGGLAKIVKDLGRDSQQQWEVGVAEDLGEVAERKGIEGDKIGRLGAQLMLATCSGLGTVEPKVNEEFPDFKPIKLEEYIRKAWGS